jgi:pimeloyl-ACP methyl ester carboxylesterase
MPSEQKPTVVLVHGAFADGSSWNMVIERLQAKGYTVQAPAIALRGVTVDTEYLSSVVKQIEGPVLLVGHSYGGALISNVDASNVVALVFVAAFAPDTDEALGDVTPDSKDSILSTALVQRDYPTDAGGATAPELFIDPAKLREVFAADLPEERTSLMAATQRPVAAAAFGDRTGTPTWKSVPSWAVVATKDKAAGADLVRSMARRAGADITEVESSHVVMLSQPRAVTDVILMAAESVRGTTAAR